MKQENYESVKRAIMRYKISTGDDSIFKRAERKEKYPCVIFDLDGTLADVSDRRALAEERQASFVKPLQRNGETNHLYKKRVAQENKNEWWKVWQDPDNIKLDKPNKPVVALCKLIKEFWGCAIIITSARTDRNMRVTKDWLSQHNIYYDEIIMRPDGDFTPDNKFKSRVLKNIILPYYEPQVVFDDRNQVVRMWRDKGIPCFQVADGDF